MATNNAADTTGNLKDRIEDITGANFFTPVGFSTYEAILTRYVKEAVRDVVDRTLQVNPKDMHLFCQNIFIRDMGTWGDTQNELTFGNHSIPWKDNDGGYFLDNNYVLWVAREYGGIEVPAHEISAEKGLKVEDPESIYFTGSDFRNPVWYRSSSKLYIYPQISDVDKGRGSMVKFDGSVTCLDKSIEYFPDHLLFLIVLYSAIKGLKLVKAQARAEYTNKYATPISVWQTLYGSGASLPSLPVFPTELPSFGNSFIHSDNSTGDLNYSFPDDIQQDPELTGAMVDSAETVKTAMENIWNRINNEEETDLVSAEISRFTLLMNEFNNKVAVLEKKHQVQLTAFAAEVQHFTQQYQTIMDAWTRYQQSYQTEQSLLDVEIQRLERDYMSYFYPKHYLEKQKEEGNY